MVQRAQSKFASCEKTLSEIIKNYKINEKKFQDSLETAYLTLFKQYLSSNIPMALRLADFLQKPEIWENLKRNTQKDIKFFFGVQSI